MDISISQVVIWLLMSIIVGCAGELIAGRHALDGFMGAIFLALLAILLVDGIFHFQVVGEPHYFNVPLISTLFAAAVLVTVWSGYLYHHS